MKDTLASTIYGMESKVSAGADLVKSVSQKLPDVLYVELNNEDVFYSVCFLHEISKVVTRPMRKASFRKIVSFVRERVKVVIIDISCDRTERLSILKDVCCRFREGSGAPFIVFESESTSLLVSMGEDFHFIDDLVPRDIHIDDLRRKIRVLKELKSLKTGNGSQGREERLVGLKGGKIITANYLVKRSVDIIAACFLLILLSPIMLVIAIMIKLTSKGPIFYKADRSGRDYKIFGFIKFRSMYLDADKKLEKMLEKNQYSTEDQGPIFFKMSDDPRITPVGGFLRNTSLDELPQLFNVLIGEMSLVGNRPLPLYEARTLTTDDCVERFDAPAGITGLWQVKKRGAKEMSTRDRIDLDIKYARNYSLKYDMKIIFQTPRALIQKDNV